MENKIQKLIPVLSQYPKQRDKAFRFIDQLEFYGGNTWICKPIEGYNKTHYFVTPASCTCQFHTSTNKPCSHMMALWIKLNKQVNER